MNLVMIKDNLLLVVYKVYIDFETCDDIVEMI
jgi:hypothetical protein